MTTAALRSKLHAYIDEADIMVLDVVYQFLQAQRENQASLLTKEQQEEVRQRSAAYKSGSTQAFSLEEARAHLKRNRPQ
jgi:hypothetical protein